MHEDMKPAGLIRRLAAIAYDGLLLFGILFFISIPIVILFEKLTGTALIDHPAHFVYTFFMFITAFIYFGWFWTHTGQTLGMKAWRVRISSQDDSQITWFQAFLRFVGSIISWLAVGIGFVWSLTNRNRTSWHDMLSGTKLLLTPPNKTAFSGSDSAK